MEDLSTSTSSAYSERNGPSSKREIKLTRKPSQLMLLDSPTDTAILERECRSALQLNKIHSFLWLAGIPRPARSLHRQTCFYEPFTSSRPPTNIQYGTKRQYSFSLCLNISSITNSGNKNCATISHYAEVLAASSCPTSGLCDTRVTCVSPALRAYYQPMYTGTLGLRLPQTSTCAWTVLHCTR